MMDDAKYFFRHPWRRTRIGDKVPGVGAIHCEPWKEGFVDLIVCLEFQDLDSH